MTGVQTCALPIYPLGLLTDEVGTTGHDKRTLLGSSGRVQAWRGAIDQGNERPLLGYGFGTEARVFYDRYQTFEAGLTENSYIGLYLQLGLIGVAGFIALVVAAIRAGLGIPVGSHRSLVSALHGVIAGGLVLMCVQSYVYSPGNLANVPVWLSGGLAVGLARGAGSTGRPGGGRRRTGVLWAACLVAGALLIPLGVWQKQRAEAATGRQMQSLGGQVHLAGDGATIIATYPVILGMRAGEVRPRRIGSLVVIQDISPAQARSEEHTSELRHMSESRMPSSA